MSPPLVYEFVQERDPISFFLSSQSIKHGLCMTNTREEKERVWRKGGGEERKYWHRVILLILVQLLQNDAIIWAKKNRIFCKGYRKYYTLPSKGSMGHQEISVKANIYWEVPNILFKLSCSILSTALRGLYYYVFRWVNLLREVSCTASKLLSWGFEPSC